MINMIVLALVCLVGGGAISAGYFAFISLIGVFSKIMEKVKGTRHYLLIECLLAYGAAVFNLIYIFHINVPVTVFGLSFFSFFGGIFVGCLAGALAEVLNVFPIISRRTGVRDHMPYLIVCVGLGKLLGSILGLFANGL